MSECNEDHYSASAVDKEIDNIIQDALETWKDTLYISLSRHIRNALLERFCVRDHTYCGLTGKLRACNHPIFDCHYCGRAREEEK